MTKPRFLRVSALVGLILLSGLLAGCITVGQTFPERAVDLLKPGVTTQSEVLKIFGNPMRTGLDSGKVAYTYMLYSASIFGKFEGRDLVIRFSPDNTVDSFTYNTTHTDEKLK